MIATDSSSFIAYLEGEEARDTHHVIAAMDNDTLMLPPPVLTEILSDPFLSKETVHAIKHLPVLTIFPDFWSRAGLLRAQLLAKKLKARLADTLIAQSCIDHQIPLITRDSDFRHYVKYGLVLFNE